MKTLTLFCRPVSSKATLEWLSCVSNAAGCLFLWNMLMLISTGDCWTTNQMSRNLSFPSPSSLLRALPHSLFHC